jgi:hypothetical protein
MAAFFPGWPHRSFTGPEGTVFHYDATTVIVDVPIASEKTISDPMWRPLYNEREDVGGMRVVIPLPDLLAFVAAQRQEGE